MGPPSSVSQAGAQAGRDEVLLRFLGRVGHDGDRRSSGTGGPRRGPPPLPGAGGARRGPPPLPGRGGPRGAPPLPGGLLGGPRAADPGLTKPKIKPGKKMKPLFWSKIPSTKVSATVWMDFDESGIDIHVSEFEALFSKVSKKKAGGANSAGKGGSGGPAKPKKVSLLDGKRQQNAGILCRSAAGGQRSACPSGHGS